MHRREVARGRGGVEVVARRREGQPREAAHLVAQVDLLVAHAAAGRVERPDLQRALAARRDQVLGRVAPLNALLPAAPAHARGRLHVRPVGDDAAVGQVPHHHLVVALDAHGEHEALVLRDRDVHDAVVVLLHPVDELARLPVPHDHVGVVARLRRDEVTPAPRHGQARDQVVVPTQEGLLVRVIDVADHHTRARRVGHLVPVGVHMQRRARAAAEAYRMLKLQRDCCHGRPGADGATLRRNAACKPQRRFSQGDCGGILGGTWFTSRRRKIRSVSAGSQSVLIGAAGAKFRRGGGLCPPHGGTNGSSGGGGIGARSSSSKMPSSSSRSRSHGSEIWLGLGLG